MYAITPSSMLPGVKELTVKLVGRLNKEEIMNHNNPVKLFRNLNSPGLLG